MKKSKKFLTLLSLLILFLITSMLSVSAEESVDSQGSLSYTELSNGTYEVSGIGSYSSLDVVIPSSYLGKTVTSVGARAFSGKPITSVVIPDSVTSIGERAFSSCASLESVSIGGGVTYIGMRSFYGCTSLVEIIIPESVKTMDSYVFQNCTSLKRACVQNETIGVYAFSGCSALRSLSISKNLNSIENGAFNACTSILVIKYEGSDAEWNSITVGNGNARLTSAAKIYADSYPTVTSSGIAFTSGGDGTCTVSSIGTCKDKDIVIPYLSPSGDVVTSIGAKAFNGNKTITSVTVPASVTTIGNQAFSSCTSLTSVTLSEGVKSIGLRAFYNCTSLKEVVIPSSVETMDNYVFQNCTGLVKATVNSKVISGYAFSGCSSLKRVYIGSGVETITAYAFNACGSILLVEYEGTEAEWNNITIGGGNTAVTSSKNIYVSDYPEKVSTGLTFTSNGDGTCIVKGIGTCTDTDIVIPYLSPLGDVVVGIGQSAFRKNTSITSIVIPNTVTTILNYAFQHCTGILSIDLGDGLVSIGEYAFANCSALSGTVVIPDKVTTLSRNAFANCTSIEKVIIGGGVRSVGTYAFYNCTSLSDITIGRLVRNLENYAFAQCPSIEAVHFDGNYSGYLSVVGNLGNNAIVKIDWQKLELIGHVHSFVNNAGKAPNCWDPGYADYTTCSGCAYTTYKDLEPLGHTYSGGICTVCGGTQSSEGMIYKSNGDGTCILVGIGECTSSDIILSSKSPAGDVVTSIQARAFNSNKQITSIVIPDTVKTIGIRAFSSCTNLKSLTIGESVTNIGSRAFFNCPLLTEVTIPESVLRIDNYAFQNCTGIETADINVDFVGGYIFAGCTSLKTVYLGKNVSTVAYGCFYACPVTDLYYSGDEYEYMYVAVNQNVINWLTKAKTTFHFAEHVCTMVYLEGKAPTCTEEGYESYYGCSACGYYETRTPIPPNDHAYVNGRCVVCDYVMLVGPIKSLYTRVDGDTVEFGFYPQSEVSDSELIGTLNKKAGTLPTSDNKRKWTSYGYYKNGETNNYMWYIDLSYNGARYRGVYFTSYRHESNQAGFGYYSNSVYWFKYEPISWTVLTEERGMVLLLCDMIVDAQQYQTDLEYRNGMNYVHGTDYHANNYAESTIRKWLNDTFQKTSFTKLQQEIIKDMRVINDAESTSYSPNPYACEDTTDKIFLLSYKEVGNNQYGFNPAYSVYDPARWKKTTDYAISQGAQCAWGAGSYNGNGSWWLRSPFSNYDTFASSVSQYGSISGDIVNVIKGIVPAMWLKTSEDGGTQPLYERIDEDTIEFGLYPQSLVTDSVLTKKLGALAGTLPTEENAHAFTSYYYYMNGSYYHDYMWYIDVDYGNERYRGVYFSGYRPYAPGTEGTAANSYQDDNGYEPKKLYWFKYEPISWTVLTEENGKAFLLCDMIIDSQPYDLDSGGSKTDYFYATIRDWLHINFYGTAFTELEKTLINMVEIDNSAESTESVPNQYATQNTKDRVFLPSYFEITNSDYGFDTADITDPARQKKTTDYAKVQGAWTVTHAGFEGNGFWRLRSPTVHGGVGCVAFNGLATLSVSAGTAHRGIVPALWITL